MCTHESKATRLLVVTRNQDVQVQREHAVNYERDRKPGDTPGDNTMPFMHGTRPPERDALRVGPSDSMPLVYMQECSTCTKQQLCAQSPGCRSALGHLICQLHVASKFLLYRRPGGRAFVTFSTLCVVLVPGPGPQGSPFAT